MPPSSSTCILNCRCLSPTSEVPVLFALVQHIVPGITKEELDKVVSLRGKAVTLETISATATTSLTKSEQMMDLVLEELDDEDLMEQLRKLRASQAAEQRRCEKQNAELASVAQWGKF